MSFQLFVRVVIIIIITGWLSPVCAQWQKNIIDDQGISGGVSVDTADLNNDDLLDLVLVSFRNNSIYWYENQFPIWIKHTVDENAPMVTFAFCSDVDSDDTLDIIAFLYSAQTLVWYENKHPQWIQHVIDSNMVGADMFQLADMNKDGILDVVCGTSNVNGGDVVWYACKYPLWERHLIESSGGKYPCLGVVDLDLDGFPDVVISDVEENRISWFKNPGEGEEWTKYHIDENYENVFGLNLGDVNNDGSMDMLTTSGGPYFEGSTVAWYENHFPSWERHLLDTNLQGATWPDVLDVNEDGRIDLIVGGYRDNSIVWYQNDDPVWTRYFIDQDITGPRLFVMTDLDSDDHQDIIVAGEQKLVWYRNPGEMAYPLSFEVPRVRPADEDTLFLSAEMYNHENHKVDLKVYLLGSETQHLDSLELFDDGLHQDGNPGDHYWANKIIYSSLPEEMIIANLVAYDSVTGTSNDYLPSQQFVSLGPLSVESIMVDNADTVFRPGSTKRIWIEMHNEGVQSKVNNISATLSSDDPYIQVVRADGYFGDIPAGESATSTRTFVIKFSEDCPVDRSVSFHLEISYNEMVAWTDSFMIYIPQSTVSIKEYDEGLIRLYPNPVKDFLSVETGTLFLQTIEITTVEGRIVNHHEYNGSNCRIDLSYFTPGVYFITIRSKDIVTTKKIIKL